jgi:hypothetical protein
VRKVRSFHVLVKKNNNLIISVTVSNFSLSHFFYAINRSLPFYVCCKILSISKFVLNPFFVCYEMINIIRHVLILPTSKFVLKSFFLCIMNCSISFYTCYKIPLASKIALKPFFSVMNRNSDIQYYLNGADVH